MFCEKDAHCVRIGRTILHPGPDLLKDLYIDSVIYCFPRFVAANIFIGIARYREMSRISIFRFSISSRCFYL